MVHKSTKKFGPFSCCFRQHRAHSHCNLLHGYGLVFKVVFEADELDSTGWVVDFGSLKSFKGMLEDNFDHKLVVAEDDPHLDTFSELAGLNIADVVVLPRVGCEAFASYVAGAAETWLASNGYAPRVRVSSVEVFEHEINSALYEETGGSLL